MTIRVLWVIKGLGPGGAETLLANAARVHDHDEFEIECAYVVPYKDHLAETLEGAGVRTHCLSRSRHDLLWPARLRSLVASGRFDIVHAHSPVPAVAARFAALTVASDHRPRLVSTEHNAWNTFHPLTRWANRLSIGRDDAIFAVSDETRRSMSARAAGRCTVVRHGIDIETVAANAAFRAAMRNELGISYDEFVIGTVANHRDQKDYPNLLRAAKLLQERDVPARVVAVGQGPLQTEIEAMRDDLGLAGTVMFTGYRSDATRVMSAFDLFTLASKYEGLPVAVMEASALGLPIVATSVGGVADEFADDAILVPAGDPAALAAGWRSVIGSPDLRTDLAERARKRSLDFDVSVSVAAYESCYRRLVALPGRSRSPAPANVRTRAVTPGVDIRPATPDDRREILGLLSRSLGWGDDSRHADLFAWKHDENPAGVSPMWVATAGDRVVGLRAFMRWNFVRDGELIRAARAVDTATDPEFQGNGLFTALTLHGLDGLRDDGIDFVFNTPNARSLPGYLRMGWQVVGRVPIAARVRSPRSLSAVARAGVPADLWSIPLDVGAASADGFGFSDHGDQPLGSRIIATDTSPVFLGWRYGHAALGYRTIETGDGALIVRGRRRGAARELAVVQAIGLERRTADRAADAVLTRTGFDVAVRCGAPLPAAGFLPLIGKGPLLTFRSLATVAMPSLANFQLQLGDIELF